MKSYEELKIGRTYYTFQTETTQQTSEAAYFSASKKIRVHQMTIDKWDFELTKAVEDNCQTVTTSFHDSNDSYQI